ncbi:GAF domain-containing sensor histidine kinase [Pseudotabrizicola sediminis]|uniref:histidine kinase n=1 Tax=Pseudotabrizicola sediminis TaxID=2486418 RepID=A0ABY2KRL3_9RHOB|nr:ATP-binding protein [Pseudotabrizicola sediminis]TGD45321.1 GAF domain-containing sensor histidine kinase [Pseudotabrizicola sediminis]
MLHITSNTLASLGLLNGTSHDGFDRQTRLARLILCAEASVMSVIDDEADRQFFRSTNGVAEPLQTERATPLSHSFCKLVRDADAPLVIADARTDDRVMEHPAVRQLGIISYLGVPIHEPSGAPIGSLCVFNSAPRNWTREEKSLIEELAAMVDEQILLIKAVQDRDVAMAAATRESDARAKFVASVGHEVRTPLNGVMGLAQVLAQDLVDPVHQTRVQAIIESGDVMLQLLNDLLDLSKIEAGKLEFNPVPFRPIDLANRLDTLYFDVAEQKGLTFEVMTNPGARALWRGDEMRINQILQNLVSNAIKFTEAGTVSVRFSCVPGRPFRVTVSDTGIGMTPEAAESLFTAFGQADATISHRFGGTGLGLSIVKHLVTGMGGAITVSSMEGRGTEFKVELPLQTVDEPVAPQDPPTLDAVAGMVVLAVDDNAANLAVIKAMLELLGLGVETARDGLEALTKVREGALTAVFMDISMPRMDGVTAALAIRTAEQGRGIPPLPLIAVTANTQPGQINSYRNSGFDDVICKPIQMGEITRAVRKHMLPVAAQAIETRP